MAVIVVDTATVTAADAYFETRLGNEAWTGASEESKLAALTTSAQVLSEITWLGVATSVDYDFPRLLPGYGSAVTPAEVLQCIYEQALHLLQNPTVLKIDTTVQSLVVGPISLQNIKPVPLITPLVYQIGLRFMRGGKTWWRAN